MRRPGGIRVVEEPEIYSLREQPKYYPAAVRARLDAQAGCIAPSKPFRRGTSKCRDGDAHLCARVEPRLGRFGETKDFVVIRGY
jgi:hypothetical protein